MENIVEILKDFGYPVAMSLITIAGIKYLFDKDTERLNEIMNEHKEETTGLRNAINEMTKTLALLLQRLNDKEWKAQIIFSP